jgi:hypothetical protein
LQALEAPPERFPSLANGIPTMREMPIKVPVSLPEWLRENAQLLGAPVCNKQVLEFGGLAVSIVGGPNARTDFHDIPFEEFFYQIKGHAILLL